MKDYRNPECVQRCGADPFIVEAIERANGVETLAQEVGCLSVNGEFNCPGPVRATCRDNFELKTGLKCQATVRTPDFMHLDEPWIANDFDVQAQQTIQDAFETKLDM